mgnify:FL=1
MLRQLTALIEKGDKYEDAYRKLYEQASAPQRAHLEKLDSLVNASNQQHTNDFFESLLSQAKRSKGDIIKLLVSHHSSLANTPFKNKAYWVGIYSTLCYSAFLVFIAVSCFTLFSTFVFPQLSDMLSLNNGVLPQFSNLIFTYSKPIIALLSLVLFPFIALMILLSAYTQAQMKSLFPLTGTLTAKIFMKKVAAKYNSHLLYLAANNLIKSGVEAAKAYEIAKQLVYPDTSPNNEPDDNLELSSTLGTLEQELLFREPSSSEDAAQAMLKMADKIPMILKPILYLVIGSLIIAMYLPIFTLGAIATI